MKIASVLLLLAGCAPAQTTIDPAKLRVEIQARDDAWSMANIAGDSAAMADFYTADMVSMRAGSADIVGRDAMVADLVQWMRTRADTLLKVETRITSIAGTDSLAWESGTVVFTGRPKTDPHAAPSNTAFKYITFWVRERDGVWRIRRDLAVPDLPPAAAP